jgi:hypothetical protein
MTDTTTDVTFDINTGEPVDLDTAHLVESHWRTGRWLKVVVHAQRNARAGFKDRPIGVMLTPTLARLVVDQQNALHSDTPWGSYPGDPDDSADPDPSI